MERRTVLGAGLGAAMVWASATTPALVDGPSRRLEDQDLAAARALFTAGEYDRLHQALPVLLTRARDSEATGPAGASRAVGVWALASQLAVKNGALETAVAFAAQAGEAARRSGRPVALAAAARAAATPLRRTGRAGHALRLLEEAYDQLGAAVRPSPGALNASGMVALTAAYTAAQAHMPSAAEEFAAWAEESTERLARASSRSPAGGELSAAQCTLYRVGIHRELGDVDKALAYAAHLDPDALPTAERRARAATDTARAWLAAGNVPAAFEQLQRVERAAPQEARRPSVRALTAQVAAGRPDLPGVTAFARRTAAPLSA
ncbi:MULTISPECIES: transcriptional regulator [Streptomyces]|uniref:Transcriptional regulator n=1 Tax=Streptomyces griseiscabiei TaxID=2993540 RepID=A0ABU4LJM7_9ACTN|nr:MULTISPECIES: transcriptional regulator [Streptomyces]MBZ3908594.1 transcriptional regulator [Streptomyces griseiscabiei]MDX2916025.1 transcriptional regulator [Streptomyces griseiscabiei]